MRLVIAVAPEVASAAERWAGIDARKLAVVPNAIDVSAFQGLSQARVQASRAELLQGRSGPLVVSVGTLAPRKAHHLLVEATPQLLEHFPDAQVAIVGPEGPNAAHVRARIASLSVQQCVACVGERRDIAQVLAAADLFVLPSLVEGLPLSLLEAMAAGTPVVAAGVGGVGSVLVDQVTGWLVPPGDVHALGRAIVRSLISSERSAELAAAARLRIEARHHAEIWAQRLTKCYAEVIGDAAKR
jgi:glycosyltransferase involved in cell wall biosynthesis